MDCKTRFDALAVKSSVAQRAPAQKAPSCFFLEIEVNFNFSETVTASQEDARAVPP
jgi:hypothetical protein